MLTTVHEPIDDRIFLKESVSLAAAGYRVTVIAPHTMDEEITGIPIKCIPKPRGRLCRFTRTARDLYREAVDQDADVYHFHDPELFPVALLLKMRGKKVLYDVHEDLPLDILTKLWINPWLRPPVAFMARIAEAIGVSFFDGVVAATPSIASRFPRSKTITVQNFPLQKENGNRPIAKTYCERRPVVVFIGHMNAVRGIREAVDAMGLIPKSIDARLGLAGVFSQPGIEAEVRSKKGWQRVEFFGFLSQERLQGLLSEARVGLVALHPTPAHLESQPIKLFEYMAAGVPVVASNLPRLKQIVDQTRCGLVVDPLKPRDIADAIQWLIENPEEAERMGKRGREATMKDYNWETEFEKMLLLYNHITNGQNGRHLKI